MPGYIPLIVRARQLITAVQVAYEETCRHNPHIITLSRQLKRDPPVLLLGLSLIFGSILLFNPEGIAPYIANILAFSPAVSTLKHLGHAETSAKKQKGMILLDYWVCVGTSLMVEGMLSSELVGKVIPVWWLVKGIAGLAVWMSISGMSSKYTIQVSGARSLTLVGIRILSGDNTKLIKQETNAVRSTSQTLPEAEPSPSPLANVLSALKEGFPLSVGIDTTDDLSDSPYDTASFLRDDSVPFNIVEQPSGASRLKDSAANREEPINQPLSPTDQLDEFLGGKSEVYENQRRAALSIGALAQRQELRVDKEEGEHGLDSPTFLFDHSSPMDVRAGEGSDRKALNSHKGTTEDKGGAQGISKKEMTLDELLALEK